jgi:hypothetical protein
MLGAFQSNWTVTHSGSPLTVARPCRIHTGFPRTRTNRPFYEVESESRRIARR